MLRIAAIPLLLPLLIVTVPLVFLAAWLREAFTDLRDARERGRTPG